MKEWGVCLTHEAVEPGGEVFLHREETGIMATREPLVVLLRTGQTGPRVSVPARDTGQAQPGLRRRARRPVNHPLHRPLHVFDET